MSRLCPRCLKSFDDLTLRCPEDEKRTIEDQTGRVIAGRYTLEGLLGVGGMDGAVWSAWHEATHRSVALKLLPATSAASAERFQRGARLVSGLNHPHITTVHDYGQEPSGELFLVMERLEGETLHAMLKREGAQTVDRALAITTQVLRALDHAHRRHVVHRDLKPGNLFLVQSGDQDGDMVKVLDFGIAKAFEDEGGAEALAGEVTHQRQLCGTPHYMAPEQITMGRVDARADLYAMGVVLYRMLVGRLPFEAREATQLFRAHLSEAPPSLHEANPNVDVPAAVEAIVMRALAKSPGDRFQTATEMRAALKDVRRSIGVVGEDDASLSVPPRLVDAALGAESGPDRGPRAQAPRRAGTGGAEAPTSSPAARRTKALLGASAAAALFGVGLAWALASTSQTPGAVVVIESTGAHPASEPPRPLGAPPEVDAAEVELETTPAHVSVRTALRYLGETPLRTSLPRDTERLFLEAPGYETRELKLDLGVVGRGERARFKITLAPVSRAGLAAASAPPPASAGAVKSKRPKKATQARPKPTDAPAVTEPVTSAPAPRRPASVSLIDEAESPVAPTPRAPGSRPARPPRVDLIE